jgi:hypothetical protein
MWHASKFVVLSAVVVAAAACSDTATGPVDGSALSHVISTTELGQALDTAPARVEIKLERGTLVAREVELKSSDEMSDEEYVRGLVTAVSASAGTGTLTFEMGGLAVTFASSARFRNDDEDGNLTMDEFVTRIETALAAGVQPAVRARRPAADPQAPDDATFQTTDLRIRDRAESPKLELNVDADNFEPNDAPPPEAWLNVLGLTIEIRSTTELEADDDDRDEAEVEGLVASVDLAAGRVTLTSGAIIIVPDASAFDDQDDPDDEHLMSLAAVQAALDAGQAVKGEAEGALQSADPLTILAHEVEFEIEDEDDDNGQPGQSTEFASAVQSANVEAGLFVLSSGATVRMTDSTAISGLGDLFTLQAVADALAAGKLVRAEGRATVESAGPPVTLAALTVKWEVDD